MYMCVHVSDSVVPDSVVSEPMGYSRPGSSVHGTLQARILEWVAIPFSRRSSKPRDQTGVSCIAGTFVTVWTNWNAVDIQSLSHARFFATLWTTARQTSLSFTISGACSNPCPLSQWCHPTISSSVVPLSHLQSFPASGSFQMSQYFASGGQSIGASVSVLPMNIQDWFPLGLTGLISLQSKRLSRVFSNTTVQKHQFFSAQPSLWSTLTSIHDYWKNHSFDYMNICWQSDVSAF